MSQRKKVIPCTIGRDSGISSNLCRTVRLLASGSTVELEPADSLSTASYHPSFNALARGSSSSILQDPAGKPRPVAAAPDPPSSGLPLSNRIPFVYHTTSNNSYWDVLILCKDVGFPPLWKALTQNRVIGDRPSFQCKLSFDMYI